MDSKVGEKYLGLGDGDEHTWNGMEWNGANSDLATAATTEKKVKPKRGPKETLNSAPK